MDSASPRPGQGHAGLLAELEAYYDEVPRAFATAEDIGGFTVFVRRDPRGWPYYARPRLTSSGAVGLEEVERVRARQRELGAPQAFEWVEETSPALGPVLREAGLEVERHPLMVLAEPLAVPAPDGVRISVLSESDPDHVLGGTTAAVAAAFGDVDAVEAFDRAERVDALRARLSGGRLRLVGAFAAEERDDATAQGPRVMAVGGGSHSPRGAVSELTGIAVLPRWRGRGVGAALTAALVDDARARGVRTVFLSAGSQRVADLYARVGFVRVGTACTAERVP
jgi:ribosomal protein S18 acetylase RimI-like enzyme